MAKLISRTDKVIKKLREEGKVKDVAGQFETHCEEAIRDIKEESNRKQKASWLAAKDVFLD